MKPFIDRPMTPGHLPPARALARAALQACLLAGAVLWLSPAVAQLRPAQAPDLPSFDHRNPAAAKADRATQRAAGLAQLGARLPAASVDFDDLLDAPKFIRATDGFLTGPNGQGRALASRPRAMVTGNDSAAPIKAFLNEHSGLFGHGAEALDNARVKRDYVDAHNGLHTMVWEQKLDGIPVYQGVLMGHVTKNGELTSLASLFVPDAAAAADAGTPNRAAIQSAPPISAAQAVSFAAQNIATPLTAKDIKFAGGPRGDGDYLVFNTPQESYVRQVWVPLDRSTLRLGWEVMVTRKSTNERFRLVLDAQTGEVFLRENLTCHLSNASYNVFTSDSPSPFSPGLQTPGTFQPLLTSRTMVTWPAYDTNASPNGWIDDGNNTTTGNNADAFVDRNFDGAPDQARPNPANNRVFDFVQDLTLDPSNYMDASTVQLFYDCNYYHDRLYQLGFTEAAGNYQDNNFGRGGIGNDHIICYVQCGADTGSPFNYNNSMFQPAPDGFNGQCYMFVYTGPTPDRDAALDGDVVHHEMTHGTSWRLVGGGMNLGSLQGDGMGEGWSDFYALSIQSQNGDDPNAAYPSAGYTGYLLYGLTQNYYFGDRRYPYCTDMRKNPLTFKDVDPAQAIPHTGVPISPLWPFDPTMADEVHMQGEVWCVTLWEVRANLVNKYGWTIGNQMTLQLITDGMKLTPPYPNMLQARDAILLADNVDTGGANAAEIWRGFAKRGMGVSAYSPNGNTTAGLIEAYDTPGVALDKILVLGGNGNGLIDPNECNSLQVSLFNNSGFFVSGISATLSTATPGVLIAQPTSPFADMAPGVTNICSVPFKVSTAPTFSCGTPINFTLLITAAQTPPARVNFQLPTGTTLTPRRFDNGNAMNIPDAGETNSIVIVSNFPSSIVKATVSLYITHTYDSDLVIQLISPDGTTNTLSANNGGAGRNYGLACAPDDARTTFDDAATNYITAALPPFAGAYQPEQPLARFIGKSGTNVNGAWRLRVVDQVRGDAGILQCWSLNLTPASCIDGGGECPGSDMSVGITAMPDPVVIGDRITYTITVTNAGPSSTKSAVLTHILPSGVTFVSAQPSIGSWSLSTDGSIVTCTLGPMAARSTATVTVVCDAIKQGDFISSVTASSDQPDFNPVNNTAAVATHIQPPTSDMAVSLQANPSSALVNGTLTYTVTAVNNGPSTASGVVVTSQMPAGSAILSATVSQGAVSYSGNTVVCSFGVLTNSGSATATIAVTLTAEGIAQASATVACQQSDPVQANNTANLNTVVGPAADLSVHVDVNPNPVVLLSNLTYTITVSNAGPSAASSIILTHTMQRSLTNITMYTTQGSVTRQGNSILGTLGSLSGGGTITVTVNGTPSVSGPASSTTTVASAQPDPNQNDNTVNQVVQVAPPFYNIIPAGAVLTSESFTPANGAIDNGETVTVNLRLRNIGNTMNTNLVATLLATNGITPVGNSSQTYGPIGPNITVDRPFTFTASGAPGATVTAVLALQFGPNAITNRSYAFTLPSVVTVSNTNTIAILDHTNASPYASTIAVSNLSGTLSKVTASLSNFSHSYPKDVDVLLVAPNGAKTLLLSHAGNQPTRNVNLTFDDAAPRLQLDLLGNGALPSGSWLPAAYSPAPAFSNPAPAGPYLAALSALNGINPNGVWTIYVEDDRSGDAGGITNGWALSLTTVTPVNPLADLGLTVTGPSSPSFVAGNLTYTFVVTNAGPASATDAIFTSPLPANASFVSAISSQGAAGLSEGIIIANLGSINAGSNATITVVLTPLPAAAGWFTNTAGVSAPEVDLNSANNTVSSVVNLTLPAADLVLSVASAPDPVVVGYPLTNVITVLNAGPNQALDVVLTNALPTNAIFVSATSSAGFVDVTDNILTALLGNLPPNGSASVTLVVIPAAVYPPTTGLVTNQPVINVPSVFTIAADPNLGNNSQTNAAVVNNPAPSLLPADAALVSESGPVNGAIDPNETVTVSLALTNAGTADTSPNCTATLLASDTVIPLTSGPQTYGVVAHGGNSVAVPFRFTAKANPLVTSGGTVVATLLLQDIHAAGNGAFYTNFYTNSFTFNLPNRGTFAARGAIVIPNVGPANPYPATVTVSGMTGLLSKATVTIFGLTHSFPSDINALLVSPAGQTVMLMAHAGASFPLNGVTLMFDDTGAPLPSTTALRNGTYQPSAYGSVRTLPPGAPAAPYGSTLADLNGRDANGDWSLYLFDDKAGDSGLISSGWTLDLTTVEPLSAAGADLSLVATAPSIVTMGNAVNYSFSVNNRGPIDATGVTLTSVLPAGAAFASASASQGGYSVSNGIVTFLLGSLSAGSTATATLSLTPGLAGVITNSATAATIQTDMNLGNNSAQLVTAIVGLEIKKLNGEYQVALTGVPGQTYQIQSSTDFSSWTTVSTATAVAGTPITFTISPQGTSRCFYRAVQVP